MLETRSTHWPNFVSFGVQVWIPQPATRFRSSGGAAKAKPLANKTIAAASANPAPLLADHDFIVINITNSW